LVWSDGQGERGEFSSTNWIKGENPKEGRKPPKFFFRSFCLKILNGRGKFPSVPQKFAHPPKDPPFENFDPPHPGEERIF